MSHPHELLTDLLDGTLDADARAGVDAHLAVCPSCREDLAAAAVGRTAARGLPSARPPVDLPDRIVVAASGGGPSSAFARWNRWAGVVAVAAVVAVIALALPEIGGAPDRPAQEVALPGATESTLDAAGAAAVPALEESDRNYREQDLTALVSDVTALRASSAPAVATSSGEAAADCVGRALTEAPPGALVRLIHARFAGTDAYLAVYLEGPGAGEAPDTAVVWVISVEDCAILSFAQAQL
ncbi:MAG TPA: zf-HC2 domain-containing protein [Actinomycetota bacterium]|nr:zf-HC2 domain-containing protein [Actinomycetota bacterium]